MVDMFSENLLSSSPPLASRKNPIVLCVPGHMSVCMGQVPTHTKAEPNRVGLVTRSDSITECVLVQSAILAGG